MAIIVFILLFLGYMPNSYAQYVKPTNREIAKDTTNNANGVGLWREKLSIGGSFWLNFNPTFVNISPLISYRYNDKFIPAVGVTYMYRQFAGINGFGTHVIGGRALAHYFYTSYLGFTAEVETLNTSYYNTIIQARERINVFNPLIGLTYRLSNTRFGVSVLYNLNHVEGKTPYPNPLILRVGIIF